MVKTFKRIWHEGLTYKIDQTGYPKYIEQFTVGRYVDGLKFSGIETTKIPPLDEWKLGCHRGRGAFTTPIFHLQRRYPKARIFQKQNHDELYTNDTVIAYQTYLGGQRVREMKNSDQR